MKQIVVLIFCSFSFSVTTHAKDDKDLMKANYYYTHNAYNEAIPFFEKLSEKATTPDIFEKLGDCYRLTGNVDRSIVAYEKAISLGNTSDKTILNYGLLLMRAARYDNAKKQFEQYSEKHPGDTRTATLIRSCTSAAERMNTEFPAGIIYFAPFNSDGSEFAPTLWNGQLVFTSDSVTDTRKQTDKWSGNAYYGIYSIPCSDASNFGNEISKISGPKDLNIKYHTGPATFTANGREMYFTRSRYDGRGFLAGKAVGAKDSTVALEIMIASNYNDADKRFKSLTPFQHNNANYSVAHPSVSPNGKLLTFSSDRPGGIGGRDLYTCKAMGKNKWTIPRNIGQALNTEGDEVFPWWADDATLYFSSDGLEGLGGLDIYRVTYDEAADSFSKPENMPQPLNSPYDEMSLGMQANAGSGYFSSDRPAPRGGDNIYYYKRMNVYLRVNVTDSFTGKKIATQITSRSTRGTNEVAATPELPYTEHLWPNGEYHVSIRKDQYKSRSFSLVAVSDSKKERDTIVKNIRLSPIIKTWDSTFAITVTAETPVSRQGIMDTPAITKYEVDKVYVIGYFDFNFSKFYYKANQADVNVEKKVILDTLYNILLRNPTMVIQVQAHSDCRGTDEYNMKLSIDRAFSVVDYLRKRGIAKNRLEYKGFGETAPVVPCPDCQACTEEEHAQNRVLEFKVLKI